MTGRVFARLLVLMFLFVAEGATLAACTEGPHTPDATYVYKSVDGRNLQLFVYRDVNASKAASARPAIVLFHGGGWRTGRPESFARLAGCLADRSGMVAITVSYRLGSGVRSGAELGVEDAISAMSWVRQYAGMLGINRHQIAAAGGSAGGHLALATVLFEDTMRPFTRHAVSARPDALVLFNPVVDLVGKWEEVFKTDLRAISPLQQLDGPLPPTILFQGTADRVTPLSSAQRFVEKARDAGSRQVELVTFAGRGHGFSQRTYGGSDDFTTTQERTAAFLSRLGWDLTQGGGVCMGREGRLRGWTVRARGVATNLPHGLPAVHQPIGTARSDCRPEPCATGREEARWRSVAWCETDGFRAKPDSGHCREASQGCVGIQGGCRREPSTVKGRSGQSRSFRRP